MNQHLSVIGTMEFIISPDNFYKLYCHHKKIGHGI